jgi:hypothetical protein
MYQQKIGNFVIKAFFDKERCKLINKVTYFRKNLPIQVLKDPKSLKYVGLELIKSDLLRIKEWIDISLKLLSKKEKDADVEHILQSLFISIVTTYWKCFADTKGRHRIHLNKNNIDPEYLSLHEELKRIRNNFAAHSGDDPFESGYLLLVKDLERKTRFEPFTLPIHRKAANADIRFNQRIAILVESLIKETEKQQKVLHEIIMSSTV